MPTDTSYAALDGNIRAPSFTFKDRPTTGFYYDTNTSEMCAVVSGTVVAKFSSSGVQLVGGGFSLASDVSMAIDDWTVTADDLTWDVDAFDIDATGVLDFSSAGQMTLTSSLDINLVATDDLLVTCESTVITATGDVTLTVTDDIIATCESASVTATGDVTLAITDDLIVTCESTSVTATGDVTLAVTDDIITSCDAYTITSVSANSLAVGRQGATTPVLQVDSSTAVQAAGLTITGAATTAGVALAALGGAAEPMSINAKGTGALSLQSVATGGVKIGTSTAECAVIKGIYLSAVLAVTIPSFVATAADAVVETATVAAAFTVQPAVGDAVIAIPQEALPTDCLLATAYVTNTDEITFTFNSKEGGGVTGAAKNFKVLLIDLT